MASIKQLLDIRLWDETKQEWVDGFPTTVAKAVKTSDGSDVQTKLDGISSSINNAVDTAVTNLKGGVVTEGDTLAKLYGHISGLLTLTQSDTETLDTLQEVVDFIKNNRTEIDAIGTNKVNITDIVNVLTTIETVDGKVLDARQGKILKDLIDNLELDLAGLLEDFGTLQNTTIPNLITATRPIISDSPPSNPIAGQVWYKSAGTIEI